MDWYEQMFRSFFPYTYNSNRNFSIGEDLQDPKAYLEPSLTFKMEFFPKITIIKKSSIVDFQLISNYVRLSLQGKKPKF